MKHLSLLSAICILGALPLSSQDRPYGLRTDLIERTDVVYRGGYATSISLPQMSLTAASGQEGFQYAAIATPNPSFSWIVPDEIEGQTAGCVMQESYRIRLYRIDSLKAGPLPVTEPERTLVWDSGEVNDGRSTAVRYSGPALEPDTIYGWEVKTVSACTSIGYNMPTCVPNGTESGWSDLKLFKTASKLSESAVSLEPLVKTDQRPTKVKDLGDGTLFADFGKAAFGQVRLTVSGVSSRQKVVLHLGERVKDGRVDRKPFGTCRYRRIELDIQPGTCTYTPEILPDWRNTHGDAVLMPDYIGEVLPFRYLEIEGLPSGTSVDIVRMYAHHPTSMDGEFKSSDGILDQVWELCKYSMEATSFIGYHVDGDRERIPYECDALINQLGWYGADRSYTLSRRTVSYLLDHPTWPTEWILQTILMAWYDYMYTGDDRLLAARYDILCDHTLTSLRQANGLVSTTAKAQSPGFLQRIRRTEPIRDIVDWPQGKGSFGLKGSDPGEADFFEFSDYNAVVNAYHYATLQCMAGIARALGKDGEATDWEDDAAQFRTRYNKAFLDRRTGLYKDGLQSSHSALHSNMFPLAFGLVPEKNVAKVAKFIAGKGTACSIANAEFLLDALYGAGEGEEALRILTATHDRSWFNTIKAGSTISFEAWDDKYKNNQDWNHAWGAAPANLIPHRFLGVEPLSPGWDRILVKPQTGFTRHAEGTVPTIKGPVRITVDNDASGSRISLHLPANTITTLMVPLSKGIDGQMTVDGAEAPAKREGRFLVLYGIGSGKHEIEVR